MRVPPWRILAGLGGLQRHEIADFLAVFEATNVGNLAVDTLQDRIAQDKRLNAGKQKYFELRVKEASNALDASQSPTAVLRLRLWAEMQSALGVEALLPLSTRTGRKTTADLAAAAAAELARPADPRVNTQEKPHTKRWGELLRRVFGRRQAPDFTAVVYAQLSRLLVEAASEEAQSEHKKAELLSRLRQRMEDLPPEQRDNAVERAIANGDLASLGLLVGGGSLAGLAVSVELMGFGAYILAAKASAFIPFFSGPATVSTLFVLSNPLFAVPAFLGTVALANHAVSGRVKAQLAAGLTVMLALKSVGAEAEGLRTCLDDFRTFSDQPLKEERLDAYRAHAERVRRRFGRALPRSAGSPPGQFAHSPFPLKHENFADVLFPGDDGTVAAGIVGALTLGDMAYAAAAIDPRVVLAADFSNGEMIDSLLDFGLFASGRAALDGASADAASASLQGFVAERIVASRLVAEGHQVSLPPDFNQIGYDLVVDGARFQVKCVQDLDALAEHFAKYPDIPVIANAELAGDLVATTAEWKNRVFFVEGFERETTIDIVQRSIHAGADLVSLDVPVFAVAVSAARNLHGWWKGKIPLSELPAEVALDGTVHGSVAAGGALTGQALGLLLFGPAGAVVFSGVGGVASLLLVRIARQKLDDWRDPAYRYEIARSTTHLLDTLDGVVDRKKQALGWKLAVMAEPLSAEQAWLRDRFLDDSVFLAETAAAVEEVRAQKDELARAAAAMRLMPKYAIHPWPAQGDIRALSKTIEGRKPLTQTFTDKTAPSIHAVTQAGATVLRQVGSIVGGSTGSGRRK